MFLRFALWLQMLFTGALQSYEGRLSRARGLSMLEYALMALVVIVIFGIILNRFPTFVENIIGRVEGLFGQTAPGGR